MNEFFKQNKSKTIKQLYTVQWHATTFVSVVVRLIPAKVIYSFFLRDGVTCETPC